MTDSVQARLAQLSPEQRALLFEKLQKRRLQTNSTTSAPTLPITPVDRSGPLPLSFAQQRLWFLDQLGSGSAYNIPAALHLRGALQHMALEQSLNEIVRRHESLRTTFALVADEPVQKIEPASRFQLPLIDLTHLPDDRQAEEVQKLTQAEAIRPFNLSKDILLRATLVRLADEAHVLLLTFHHIAADGWSLGVFVQELTTLYGAFRAGRPSPLPELTIQYADFAHWQRAWLQGERLAQQLAYWKAQLADAPPLLELPTDYVRPTIETFQGDQVVFEINAALTQQLRQISTQAGTTLFMTLLAAFQVLLARYSGQEDILVGSPIANRTHPALEPLIGFFANTLVLRSQLSGNPTFLAFLEQVRQVTQAAYEHQEIPFEKLVEELQPARALNYNPLVQVIFALQNSSLTPPTLADLQVTTATFAVQSVRFDLEVHLREADDQLIGTAIYNTALFTAATMQRMMAHFQVLLAGIMADPAQRIGELSLLTPVEAQQLLMEWNPPGPYAYGDRCLHEWFEAQVERTPDAVAVGDWRAETRDQKSENREQRPEIRGQKLEIGVSATESLFSNLQSPISSLQSLTYRELNGRANQLAHALQRLGVKAETPVGLCVERSLAMIIGLLGILKAGGAYVPLDPTYPKSRLATLIEDSAISVLVTQQTHLTDLPPLVGTVLCLDTDWPAHESTENPNVQLTLDHLLYILYTSGSTGRPKGVAMSHRPLVNLLHWQGQKTPLAQPARTLQFTPLSFDVSCQEIFATLSTGGTLVLISEETRRDPSALLCLLAEQRIEHLFLPFVALQQLAEAALQEAALPKPLALRQIITAGEQLQITPALAQFCTQTGCTLHNHYGPTETHVVSAFTLTGPVATWPRLPPIGQPIANTQFYILDQWGQLCPSGVPGELYIGGANLARGYLKQPALVAQRFIPDPFSAKPGACLYRTGDRVRYRADGNVEFLGRLDEQIKLRGFRIELGEIEAVLRQHPAVREAVAVIHADPSGERQLVAYVVERRPESREQNSEVRGQRAESSPPNLQSPVSGLHFADLRAFLQQQLPAYMMPAVFVLLDALPLTPTGKVNRRALPAPSAYAPTRSGDYVPPRTTTEKLLAQIWGEVLHLAPISVDANFFEIGGHSLLATQIALRIRQRFSLELPLRTLFECATVATLAERLDDMQTVLKLQTSTADDTEAQEEIVL